MKCGWRARRKRDDEELKARRRTRPCVQRSLLSVKVKPHNALRCTLSLHTMRPFFTSVPHAHINTTFTCLVALKRRLFIPNKSANQRNDLAKVCLFLFFSFSMRDLSR